MFRFLETLLTDGSCVLIAIGCIKVALIHSLIASSAIHVFEIVNFLHSLTNLLILHSTNHVSIAYFRNFTFALRARVLHLSDPALDAGKAVFVSALIQLGIRV